MDIHLSELDLNDVASWPVTAKLLLLGVIGVGLLLLGYWFDISKQVAKLDQARQEEIQLKQTFANKEHQASNLDAYKEQMLHMHRTFDSLLKQLPEKSEVPGLLEDISHQGLATGLAFKTIRLEPEKEVDFYSELPIDIIATGNYHQLAEFVSHVASLPRIVTLHNFSIRPTDLEHPTASLTMTITAKTYRYTAEGAHA